MKDKTLIVILIITTIIAISLPSRGITKQSDVVWLARSCVGEAGWNSWQTGECAAILHIYRKRALLTGETMVQLAKRYSAAIKRRSGRNNKWVLGLSGNGKRPERWPSELNWDRFRFHWVMTMILVEFFFLDLVEDPLPQSIHYGSVFDKPHESLKVIKSKFRNKFYKLKGFKKW